MSRAEREDRESRGHAQGMQLAILRHQLSSCRDIWKLDPSINAEAEKTWTSINIYPNALTRLCMPKAVTTAHVTKEEKSIVSEIYGR